MGRIQMLNRLLENHQYVEKKSNCFAKFSLVAQRKEIKQGASINGMLYHNKYILNLRKADEVIAEERKKKITSNKSKKKYFGDSMESCT